MIEITRLAKTGGALTKRISLAATGKPVSDGSACTMARGSAQRVRFDGLAAFAELIGGLAPHEAIALGALHPDLPDRVEITTKGALNGAGRPDLIARTAAHIAYRSGTSALALLDFDRKGMSSEVAAALASAGGFWAALVTMVPELATAAYVSRASTSAGLYRADTSEALPGSGGEHIYLVIKDGADCGRFLKALHERCWLAGLGWMMVGVGGQLLERSIVDRMVGAPERLVFEGAPVLDPPLAQYQRPAVATEGEAIDTVAACPPLTIVETARFDAAVGAASHRLAPLVARARDSFVKDHAATLAARTGMDPRLAERVVERQCAGVLLPDVALPFDDPSLAGRTVSDVLADPARFDGETLADPIEGVSYGACKAKIMRQPDGKPWIHSFAHGRTTYALRYDFRSAKAAIEKAPADESARKFVALCLSGDLAADEFETLRDIAAERGKVGKASLNAMMKAARHTAAEQKAKEDRWRRAAERQDSRPQINAPRPDAEWLPVMAGLNDVLGKSEALEPPARDIDGVLVRVWDRRVANMHLLAASGANDEETEDSRLPPPEQPLLTRLPEVMAAEMIERHVEYIDPASGRSVHLDSAFGKHFHTRPGDDALPIISAIATLPIVMRDGNMLAGRGLDRERGIVFRIPSALLAMLPRPADCTPGKVAEAIRFLCDEWLCDVAADYAGKCILLGAAMTVIERSILPDRPVFFVTAGRRGGGKTTALIMLLMAVTGARPSAAAWSPNEEERRKALLAYLLEALPAIVWDNIPRGSQIFCPHIERSCTSEFYSDRRLGVSQAIAVSAATVHMFTGNNIGPRGDLASRALTARLEVETADPENRPFLHPDPIGWTEAHRGKILQALYTIMLGNPRLTDKAATPAVTRFKDWWHVCGSAIESAAKEHAAHVKGNVMDGNPKCPAREVSFKDLFISQEEEEEDSGSLAAALGALTAKWPPETVFQAAEVAKFINPPTEFPGGEPDLILREYLFPALPPGQAVGAIAVAKRLKNHVGEPVPNGAETLILKSTKDGHTKTAGYYISVTKNGGCG